MVLKFSNLSIIIQCRSGLKFSKFAMFTVKCKYDSMYLQGKYRRGLNFDNGKKLSY